MTGACLDFSSWQGGSTWRMERGPARQIYHSFVFYFKVHVCGVLEPHVPCARPLILLYVCVRV